MSSLLERRIATIEQQLVVIPPPLASTVEGLRSVQVGPKQQQRLLREAQRLRGRIYLRDGAISERQLAPDGAFVTDDDTRSWQFLLLDNDGGVGACSWYLRHENTATLHELRARRCALLSHPETRGWARGAVEAELALARSEGVHYAEVGGWAVAEHRRCSTEALMLIVVTFAVSRVLGGALGLATATTRHSSSEILRRVGFGHLGGDLRSVYFDPQYDCEMELLRFDTRRLAPRYDALVDQLAARLDTGFPELAALSPAPCATKHERVAA
jgi:hypothetical protein